MLDRDHYTPGPAHGARIEKGRIQKGQVQSSQVKSDEDKWTLILVRELRHSPEKVWQALTDPAQLREWAPFVVDASLGAVGSVNLTWVGRPSPIETKVTRAEAPRLLEYGDTRWELEAVGSGTRLTLWHVIDRRFISWGAAGWHICFDVLARLLAGQPIGPLVGADAMKSDGWRRLNAEYAKQFANETPECRPNAAQKSESDG